LRAPPLLKKSLGYARKKPGDTSMKLPLISTSPTSIFFSIGLKWLWKKMFEGIDVDSSVLGTVKEWARKGL